MILSVYLRKDVINMIECYGELSDVVNKMLEVCDDLENKPNCPSNKSGLRRVSLNITEPRYIRLCEEYGTMSKSISIARFIYWFVENELFEDYGMTPVNDYDSKTKSHFVSAIENAKQFLIKSKKYYTFQQIDNAISLIDEVLNNGLQ